MTREPSQVIAAMAAAGRLVPFDDATTWEDALFTLTPGGSPRLTPGGAPDRELLAALAEEYAALDRHLGDLPERLRRHWLERILRIERLPALPDRVIVHATVDPKTAPTVVPKGTLLRGGKDAFGNERRYATLDALTAHGAALTGIRSLVPGAISGLTGVVAEAPPLPLRPALGEPARHSLRIYSPALVFEGGTLTVAVAFSGTSSVAGLAGAVWGWSRADGIPSSTTGGTVSGAAVTLTLSGACGAPPGDTPWVECRIPADLPVPVGLSFTDVTVRVVSREGVTPQAAFYNDGAVDVTKEFQPFGAVAKRGDAFYVRCDEAFGKAMDTVSITVTLMQEGGATLSSSAGGSGIPDFVASGVQAHLNQMKAILGSTYTSVATQWEAISGTLSSPSTPTVRWQRRLGGTWQKFGSESSRFSGVTASDLGSPVASETFAVAGQPGHYVRAFLAAGDFGWTKYQKDVADFATAAADPRQTNKRAMPTVPVPPIASAITVGYTTAPVAATGVESRSGWRHLVRKGPGTFAPFRLAAADNGWGAMVALGLELPPGALGSSVSLWFEVESPAPCGSADPVDAAWEWWDGSAWQALAVADGTRALRESGLLRFVGPFAWEAGCPETDSDSGRWVRLVAQDASRIGEVLGVAVDAVVAEFVSAAKDPTLDPSSVAALPRGTIKGTLSPITGVKKVTNLSSVRGRGPEADADYVSRASTMTRHRGRAVTPWDYEQHVALAFPEVAAVVCLPHTDRDGGRSPGSVGLVVVPDRPGDPAPRPSVSLSGRIMDAVSPVIPVGAAAVVLCAAYEPVTVVATIRLRPGVAALTGKESVTAALERFLHPTGTLPVRWGRTLYASTVIAFLERHPNVDVVDRFELRDGAGHAIEMVEVDPCRGLYCSSAEHLLTCEEQL